MTCPLLQNQSYPCLPNFKSASHLNVHFFFDNENFFQHISSRASNKIIIVKHLAQCLAHSKYYINVSYNYYQGTEKAKENFKRISLKK